MFIQFSNKQNTKPQAGSPMVATEVIEFLSGEGAIAKSTVIIKADPGERPWESVVISNPDCKAILIKYFFIEGGSCDDCLSGSEVVASKSFHLPAGITTLPLPSAYYTKFEIQTLNQVGGTVTATATPIKLIIFAQSQSRAEGCQILVPTT